MGLPVQFIENKHELCLQIGERKLTLHNGDVLNVNAEALVCPVDQNLDFSAGLPRVVSVAAGKAIAKERPLTSEPFGKVVVMPGGKLKAKFIFLTVIYGQKDLDKMRQSIRQSVERAIRYAEFLRLKSIAFPLLGDPRHSAPYDAVTREMLENVVQYFQRRNTKLKAILFSAFNTTAFDTLRKEARQLAD